MWTPTHVKVTVQRCKGILSKGKNGTNDAFVTIALGKEKYQTSVKDKASAESVEWNEECELPIPKQGNKAEIVLSVLHRNFLGDEFLGQSTIPLADFDVYEKPKNKWYSLKSKPGKEKAKYRGEIEVRIGFTVQSGDANAGSFNNLSKKDSLRASFGQLSQKATSFGGSLLSLKEKNKGLKSLAKAVGNKVSTLPGRGKKKNKDDSFGTIPEQKVYTSTLGIGGNQSLHDADPGVISDEDEFRFEELSHKSSHSSLSVSQVALSTPKDGSLENLGGGEFLRRNYATPPPGKPNRVSAPPVVDPISWNTATSSQPADDWQAKLFGKNNANNLQDNSAYSTAVTPKVYDTMEYNRTESKSDFTENKETKSSTPHLPSVTSKESKEKEPVPKPRPKVQVIVQDTTKMEIKIEDVPKPQQRYDMDKSTVEVKEKEKNDKKSKKEKDKVKVSEVSHSNSFTSNKHEEKEKKGILEKMVGITSPISRNKEHNHNQETRLPREVLRKFEGKSRDDLIEMVVNLQMTMDSQKQKMQDMEDYIDNLLVRVMETKPTLLQNTIGGCEHDSKLQRMTLPKIYVNKNKVVPV